MENISKTMESVSNKNLSTNDIFIATYNARNVEEAAEKMESYIVDKNNIVKLDKAVASGKEINKDQVINLYLQYLSYCCSAKNFEIVKQELSNMPDGLSSKEVLSQVKSVVEPLIEKREVDIAMFTSEELAPIVEAIAQERNLTSEEYAKRLMQKSDEQIDATFAAKGVDREKLKSMRQQYREERNAPAKSIRSMASEALMEENGINQTDLSSANANIERKDKTDERGEEYGES